MTVPAAPNKNLQLWFLLQIGTQTLDGVQREGKQNHECGEDTRSPTEIRKKRNIPGRAPCSPEPNNPDSDPFVT